MRQAALLSRHDKARLISPVLQELGWQLTELDSFDTDSLGSFAGERPRFMSPDECALRKAALAADISGFTLGLGSEGSFAPGPYGLGTFNLELISCIDVDAGWQVTGRFYGPANVQQWTIHNSDELEQALIKVPESQGLILQYPGYLSKGLYAQDARQQATERLNRTGELTLSFDLRAHHCPERQAHIQQAAGNLLQRIKSRCPQCGTPGFWPDKAIAGLPCEDCDTPSSLTKARQACCQRCGHQQIFAVEQRYAAAQYCQRCNP